MLSFWVNGGTAGERFALRFDKALNNVWFASLDAIDNDGPLAGNGSYGFALLGSDVSTPLANAFGKDSAWYINGSAPPGGAFNSFNDTWSLRKAGSEC